MGIVWTTALALLAGTNGWLITGCLEPLRDEPAPVFVLAAPPLWHLAVWWCGALGVTFGAARRLARRVRTAASPPRRGRGLLPSIVLLSMPLAAVAALASPLRPYASPWVYFFADLHGWVLAGAAVLLAADLDAEHGRPLGRWSAGLLKGLATWPRSAGWLDAALVAVLLLSSLATSPLFRFQSALLGDEPKYVRYLENWYRGRGMDVEGLEPIGELPAGHQSAVLRNFGHLGRATASVVSDIGQDVRRLAGVPAAPRPGPATGAGGWFVRGKRGGVYQVHNAGFSFLLFPGYFVDRAYLNWTSSFHPQLPSDLYCTSALILGLYLAWGIAVFRLLIAYTNRAGLSWAISALVLLSLPSTAFAYQYYPEVAGGLAIALLARFVLLSTATTLVPVIVHGLVAGYLPWLHMRFGPVAILAVVSFAATRRKNWRAVLAFVAAFSVPVTALAGYYYYVTGSITPWALHALCLDEAAPFSLPRAIRDLPNYWFDAGGGLLAHAPFYLLALPGVWLALRRSPAVFGAAALLVLSLAVPAAGHGWVGGGTTPMRLVAAVIPLLALPLADAVIRYGRSRWFAAALVVLSVVAVQNGWTYNTHLIKSEPWLVGPTTGGWLFPLLFPTGSTGTFLDEGIFEFWAVVTLLFLAWPIVRGRARGALHPVGGRLVSWTAAVTALVVSLALLGSLVGGGTGNRLRTRFMTGEQDARYHLLTFAAAHPGGQVWSSAHGRDSLESLFPVPVDAQIATGITPEAVRVGEPLEASIASDPQMRSRVWGTATVDFGDRTAATRRRFVGGVTTQHRFAAPGGYVVRFDINLPGAPGVRRVETVRVAPPQGEPALPSQALAALPPDLMKRPITIAVDEVRFGERDLDVRCSLPSRPQVEGFWVWVMTVEYGVYRARLHLGQPVAAGTDSRTVRLRVAHALTSNATEVIGVVVGAVRPGQRGMAERSDVAVLPHLSIALSRGADVVERVAARR